MFAWQNRTKSPVNLPWGGCWNFVELHIQLQTEPQFQKELASQEQICLDVVCAKLSGLS